MKNPFTHFGYVHSYYYNGVDSFGSLFLREIGIIHFDYKQVVQTDITTVKHYNCLEDHPASEIALKHLWPVKAEVRILANGTPEVVSVEVLESEFKAHGDYLCQLSLDMYENGDDTIIDIHQLFVCGVLMGLDDE